ncbi:uncharacterized protein N7469_011582 [Penicillium citrinum]|uniref:Uncharacterized protein n=1 Tax=Penicillium citrinum TaxID=5077 RepID=A0A9W9NBC4_PENCI|nr:uncharacterized protein N7469_011582 [Penicillium citrinum]KAJ5216717.1 hypothetical protein N7469_011582 [Penicillium citrinum]
MEVEKEIRHLSVNRNRKEDIVNVQLKLVMATIGQSHPEDEEDPDDHHDTQEIQNNEPEVK